MERRDLIITALALLLVLGIIFGTVFYLFRFFSSRPQTTNNRSVIPTTLNASPTTASGLPVASSNPNASLPNRPGNVLSPNEKLYTGAGFNIRYSKSWGLLTCANSQNFELDPNNGSDQTGLACDYALKSITVLVGPTSCAGTPVTLGANTFYKNKTVESNGDIKYRWCSKDTNPQLDVTHRVSVNPVRGYSTTDYSAQVEEMLKSAHFGGAS